MSYLTNALKQSKQASYAEQSHVAFVHEQQLKFYKRLVLSFIIFAAIVIMTFAGYFVGKNVNTNQSLPIAANKVPLTAVNMPQQTEAETLKLQSKKGQTTDSKAQDNKALSDLLSTEVIVKNDVKYQWVSVQLGVDSNGKAVYTQQLVPIIEHPVAVIENVQKEVKIEDKQAKDDLSQYRVLGKPLDEKTAELLKLNDQAKSELDSVSDELKSAFEQAVKNTQTHSAGKVVSSTKSSAQASPIEYLPRGLQNSIPSLRYQAHIYATDVSKRWIKINGRELYEGDTIGSLILIEITPEQALFYFDGYEFTLEAMQDWLP